MTIYPLPPTGEAVPLPVPMSHDTPSWSEVPVFIVNRNRLGALQRLVDWLLTAGTRRIVILDNASDYPPLLRYYENLPPGAKALLLPDNHGPYVLWEQGVHRSLDTPYVVTDSDIVPTDECPADLIGALLEQLKRHPEAKKVGCGLRIDNLPDAYGEAETVRRWESQFWERPIEPGVFAAPVDTTFAIYPARGEFSNEPCNLRLGRPYVVEHTPWYADEQALGAEETYYRNHTSPIFSNWSVANKDSWVRRSERVAQWVKRPQVLHMDGGRDYILGWINAGRGERRFDLDVDVTRCRSEPLQLAADSLDGIHLSHVLEPVGDPWPLFEQLHKAAKPGAKLFIRERYGARADAWTDPAQRSAWTEGSFAALERPSAQFGTSYHADWHVESVRLIAAPNCTSSAGPRDSTEVRELVAVLRAVKPPRQPRSRSMRQLTPTVTSDSCIDPAFAALDGKAKMTPPGQDEAFTRLGLPWRLPHYQALNGPHPLVLSFVDGNTAVQLVDCSFAGAASEAAVRKVTGEVLSQTCELPQSQARSLVDALALQEQVTVEEHATHCDALFLHTAPLHAGTAPWIFHFESFPSLFIPFMYTGRTTGIDLPAQPYFAHVRRMLESSSCRRIISHMRGSLEILCRTFGSAAIAAKTSHVPLGIACLADDAALAKFKTGTPLRILFTNSLHGEPSSFHLRGGHHLLEAFARLRRSIPGIELTILSRKPADVAQWLAARDPGGIRWIDSGIDDAALQALYREHHLFALPAAGLHSFSLLRAFANGCVPLVSDAPGYEEYTAGMEDSILMLSGVRKMVYTDEASGWISDDYAPFKARSDSLEGQIHDLILANGTMHRLRDMARRNLAHVRLSHPIAGSHAAFNAALREAAIG